MNHEDFAALELRTLRSAWWALDRRLDLSPGERRALMPKGGIEDRNPPVDTEARMRIMVEIGYRICMPEGMIQEWLRTATPTLDWLTPLDAMSGSMADLRGVRDLIEAGFAS